MGFTIEEGGGGGGSGDVTTAQLNAALALKEDIGQNTSSQASTGAQMQWGGTYFLPDAQSMNFASVSGNNDQFIRVIPEKNWDTPTMVPSVITDGAETIEGPISYPPEDSEIIFRAIEAPGAGDSNIMVHAAADQPGSPYNPPISQSAVTDLITDLSDTVKIDEAQTLSSLQQDSVRSKMGLGSADSPEFPGATALSNSSTVVIRDTGDNRFHPKLESKFSSTTNGMAHVFEFDPNAPENILVTNRFASDRFNVIISIFAHLGLGNSSEFFKYCLFASPTGPVGGSSTLFSNVAPASYTVDLEVTVTNTVRVTVTPPGSSKIRSMIIASRT